MSSAIEVLKKDLEYHKYILEYSLFKADAKNQKEKINALNEGILALEQKEKLKDWLEKEIERIFAKAKRTVKPEHDECICEYCCGWNQFEAFIEKEIKYYNRKQIKTEGGEND